MKGIVRISATMWRIRVVTCYANVTMSSSLSVHMRSGRQCTVYNMEIVYRGKGRDSSVGIATRYGLDGPGSETRWGRDFPHPSRAALVSCTMITGPFPPLKRPGRCADRPPPSKRRGHERVGLYLCSPSGRSWSVIGRTFTFTSPPKGSTGLSCCWRSHVSVIHNMCLVVHVKCPEFLKDCDQIWTFSTEFNKSLPYAVFTQIRPVFD